MVPIGPIAVDEHAEDQVEGSRGLSTGTAQWLTSEFRVWLVFFSLVALVYLPVLLGQVYFFRDFSRWVYPARAFVRTSLLSHQSPWWNPRQGLGLPIAASPLYGLYYPPYLLTLFGSLTRALTFVWLLHVVWGGLGVLLLARRLGTGRTGALIGALAWSLSGFATSAWSAGVILPASAWIPWCGVGALDLRRALTRGRWLRAVVSAAWPVAGSLLVGEVFQSAMGVGFGLAMLIADRISRGRITAFRQGRTIAAPAAALGLAVLLTAPVLLPTALAARATERSKPLDRGSAEMWSLHPLRLVELVAAGAFGDPYGDYPGGRLIADGVEDQRPLFYGVCLGAGVVALALAGLGRSSRSRYPRRTRTAQFVLGCVLVSIILALGRHTPVHVALRWLVPLFARQRAPEKFLSLTIACTALAAALGADRLLREPASLPWRRLAVGALLIASLALIRIALPNVPVAHTLAAAMLRAGFAVLAIVGVLLLGRLRPRLAPLLLVTAVAIDLARSATPLLVFGPASLLDQPPPLAQAALAARQVSPAPPRVYRSVEVGHEVEARERQGDTWGLEARHLATLRPGTAVAYGLAEVPGYDAGLSPRIEALWIRGHDQPFALLRLLGVEFAVLSLADGAEARVPRVAGTTAAPAALYRVGDGKRVHFAGRASILGDNATLRSVLDPDVVTGERVILAAPASSPDGGGTGHCALTSYFNTRLTAVCESNGPGFAFFAEEFARGWTAQVDGQAVPVLRANALGRAVALSKGFHTVDMSYDVPGLRLALALSALGVLVLLLGVLDPGRAVRNLVDTHPTTTSGTRYATTAEVQREGGPRRLRG